MAPVEQQSALRPTFRCGFIRVLPGVTADTPYMIKQLRYIRERFVNAVWMVRKGEFRAIVAAVFEEIGHRVNDVRVWWVKVKPKKLVHVADTAYIDPTRVIPPSARPTRLRHSAPPRMTADAGVVKAQIVEILDSLDIEEARTS